MADVCVPFVDHSNESSLATIPVADAITDLNITAIFDAIVGVTLGNAQKSVLKTAVDKDTGTAGVPANAFAQREIKWLVRYTDTTTLKKYTRELPCADLQFVTQGTDFMDLTSTEGAALKTALDAHMLSPDGNAISVDSVEHVGRST